MGHNGYTVNLIIQEKFQQKTVDKNRNNNFLLLQKLACFGCVISQKSKKNIISRNVFIFIYYDLHCYKCRFSIFVYWKFAVDGLHNLRPCTGFLFPVNSCIYYCLYTVLFFT